MLSRNKIKHIGSLQIKKYRKIYHQFIAEGTTLILDLLGSDMEILEIFATENWIADHSDLLKESQFQVHQVTIKELKLISPLTTPGNVLAVIQIPERPFDPSVANRELIVMLDDISDPGNLGTIIRTADWFGINHIICSEPSVDLYNPKVVQATMGSIARVKVYYQNLIEILENIDTSIPIFGAVMNGEDLDKVTLNKHGFILLGNESRGISEKLLHFVKYKITIPPFGENDVKHAESLNIAMASAIIFYNFRVKTY
jgi:TrmH family RNA methyltransferase